MKPSKKQMGQNLPMQSAPCKQHPEATGAVFPGGWSGDLSRNGTRLTGACQGEGDRWICAREVVILIRVM